MSRRAAATAAVAAAVLAGLFGDCLLGGRFLGFRDSLHFFPPLYRLVADEWSAGRAPLWNPWINGGQPLAATNTAGAFYPPQVLATCLLPDGLSLDILMIAHLALAGAAAFAIARDGGGSQAASLVAAVSFACAGSVLFHVYAPNALTGAAWAAWAIQGGARLLARATLGSFLVLSTALAMTVLSGDPQSAFHAGLALGILLAFSPRGREGRDAPQWRSLARRGLPLVAAAAFAGLLSLVQLALTREFMLSTTRYADMAPVSIWDVPGFLRRAGPEERGAWAAVIVGRPPPGIGFYHDMYRYGIAPWWIAECLSPTLSGRFLSRWPHDLGWEGEAWVATLYAGLVPLAGFVAAIALPATRRRTAAWTAVVVFAYLAAVGGFGLAGATRHALARVTGAADVPFYRPGDEVGGLYWMLATFLPGYGGFRYPAKWLAIFALGFSQVAAVGFDVLAVRLGRPAWIPRLFAGLGGLSAAATAAALPFAGPAAGFVAAGGALAAAVAAAAWIVDRAVRHGWLDRGLARRVLVGIVMADLVLAGRCFLDTTPFAAVVEGGAALDRLRSLRLPTLADSSAMPRLAAIDQAIGLPRTDDAAERALFTGMAMRGHTPLLHGWGKVGVAGTALEADLELFFHAPRPDRGVEVFARRMFDSAAVEFFVIPRHPPRRMPLSEFEFDWSADQRAGSDTSPSPAGDRMPGILGMRPGMTQDDVFVKYVRNESACPRARIAGGVVRIAPLDPLPGRLRTAAVETIAFPNPRLPTLGSTVVVESDADLALPDRPGDTPREEACRITRDEPRHVTIEATLTAPGLVVLADTFHPDWTLTVGSDGGQPRQLDILRVNRIHRGCVLPAGHHLLDYRHRSATFDRTWPITVAAWLAAAAIAAITCTRRRRSAA